MTSHCRCAWSWGFIRIRRTKLLHQLRSGPFGARRDSAGGPPLPSSRQSVSWGWLTKPPEISDRRNVFSKSNASGRQMLSKLWEVSFFRLPAEFRDRIYSFWDVLCETTSGSEQIHPFVIWGWGKLGVWNPLLLASGGSDRVKYKLWQGTAFRGMWKPTTLLFTNWLHPVGVFQPQS